jgi:U3 small nucleolar RNA-associated protein 21
LCWQTVGLVSPTTVPFTTLPLGKTTFQITTSVGRSLQTYDLRRGLNLVFVTRPSTPEPVTATKAWQDRVLAAWGGNTPTSPRGIWIFRRGKKVGELQLPINAEENVVQFLIFGTWIVGCCSTKVEVWKSTTLDHYTTLVPLFTGHQKSSTRLTGGICNMPTYLNKVLAGREDGSIEIWNLSSNKLVYTIFPPAANCGAVTAMQPTPALSLLAVAYANGSLHIHDIRKDQALIKLQSHQQGSYISSISFRTDGLGAGEDGRAAGMMATASYTNGDVTFWDLNSGGRKIGVLPGAHQSLPPTQHNAPGGITKIEFLPGQAILMTTGLDNTLKSWIFDENIFSPIPRILHLRGGHAGPISALHFLPPDSEGAEADGKWLISGSHDRTLWGWSLRRDGQSTELSQGNVQAKAKKRGLLSAGAESLGTQSLKAPSITCIASSLNRDGGIGALPGAQSIWNKANGSDGKTRGNNAADGGMTGWESVVTGHQNNRFARTWFWGRKRAGRWAFPTSDGTEVKVLLDCFDNFWWLADIRLQECCNVALRHICSHRLGSWQRRHVQSAVGSA